MIDFLNAALEYAENGHSVFPIIPGAKIPHKGSHGFKDATTDPDQIEKWWTDNPDSNIGMRTGQLYVVDIDGADNPFPEPPLLLIGGAVSLTPRGGKHILFKSHDEFIGGSEGIIADKVDTRADGGYIVVPPSVTEDGCYQWVETLALESVDELPELPHWFISKHLSSDNGSEPSDRDNFVVANQIVEGQRNSTLARIAGHMRQIGCDESEIKSLLLRVNVNRFSPRLPVKEIEKVSWSISRYEPDQVMTATIEGHYEVDREPAPYVDNDPGSIPEELLRVPGFINEVIDYCLSTAPYPNQAMAFAGALALQAHLGARKVRDVGDNRTNLYILGLANSSSGKDWPRRVNMHIMDSLSQATAVGDKFASGEGLEDSLFRHKSMLYQTDEIDGMLQSMTKAKDARHEGIMGTLLRLYSSAASIFPMRTRASLDEDQQINQPCLVLFGTAIPNHYYDSLSERMLTNGFFSRFLIIESGKRSRGQNAEFIEIPSRIISQAMYWKNFTNSGNLDIENPRPAVIRATASAQGLLDKGRSYADDRYEECEENSDAVGMTVWGRFNEQAMKLALIYSLSENPESPSIGKSGVEWATKIVDHQTRRMLYQAAELSADSPFHRLCQKVVKKLKEAEDQEMMHSVLLKRMKISASDFQSVMGTMLQSGEVVLSKNENKAKMYKLVGQGEQ